MKSIHRVMALSSLIIMLAASSVFAQTGSRVVIDIPFPFTVGEKTLPAGEYSIEQNRRGSNSIWVLRAENAGETAVFMTVPIRSNMTQENSKLVFRRYDELYFLAQIWTPGTSTGRELRVVGREKVLELASNRMRAEYVLVASSE